MNSKNWIPVCTGMTGWLWPLALGLLRLRQTSIDFYGLRQTFLADESND
jgi:hypothetical protein